MRTLVRAVAACSEQRGVHEEDLGFRVLQQHGRHAGVEARVERADDGAGHGNAEVELAEGRDVLREHRNLHGAATVENRPIRLLSLLSSSSFLLMKRYLLRARTVRKQIPGG